MESDFKLFELSQDKNNSELINICKHENIIIEGHKKICEDCGRDVNEVIFFKKEWKYYGICDSKLTSDPTRCQRRKKNNRGINNDIANLALSD